MALSFTWLAADFATAPQLTVENMAEAAAAGFRSVVNNRPDFEGGPSQPASDAIERAAQSVEGPTVIVAQSGGCNMVAHWAIQTRRSVHGALLAAPPDFETPMPDGYPTVAALRAGGWLPVPRERLAFPSIVAASRDDPLTTYQRAAALADDWGGRLVDLGKVGHLNPASGYGEWPLADKFIRELSAQTAPAPMI